ncbi:MAG: ATP-binding cassette domain-containing protein [Planctomycetota bacterium]
MRITVDAHIRRASGFALEVGFACDADALGLVGPSGSGKSTLLNAIAGIEPGARVVLDDVDLSRVPLEARGIGYVAQDALLFPHLNVRKNLLYSPRARALGDVPHALGIAHLLDRMPRNLSGGERRRVALARAIISAPRVLLLDEPFAGLDEFARREAMALLDQVRRQYELAMILVSHSADEIIGLTQWALRLEGGRVVSTGSSLSVLRSSETHIDNYFLGQVLGVGRVQVDAVELEAILPADMTTGAVRLAVYAQDILLATSAPTGLSARNVLPVTVRSVTPAADAVVIEFEPPRLRALITRAALAALAIAPGQRLFAIIKATSISCVGRVPT